jgi:hypothetical protein
MVMQFVRSMILVAFILATCVPTTSVWAQAEDDLCAAGCATYLPLVSDNYNVRNILVDNFSKSTSGWPTVNDEWVQYGYNQETYEMMVKKNGGVAGVFRSHEWMGDYVVSTSVRIVTGSDFVYGLIFYTSDANDEGNLFLNAEGEYSIQRYVNDEYQILKDWQNHNAVRPSGESNELSVQMAGDEYMAFINGVEVTRGNFVRTGEIPGIGLLVFSAPGFEGPATVQFDDLTVRGVEP